MHEMWERSLSTSSVPCQRCNATSASTRDTLLLIADMSVVEVAEAVLSHIQSLGVISPVEEPTQWCPRMVEVPKPSGALKICADY